MCLGDRDDLFYHRACRVLLVHDPVGKGGMILAEVFVEPHLNSIVGGESDHLVSHCNVSLDVVDGLESNQTREDKSDGILEVEPGYLRKPKRDPLVDDQELVRPVANPLVGQMLY